MRAARLAWPGLALAITFVDDFVAGPILAATGALVGGQVGVVVGVVAFTGLVAVLVGSAVLASRDLDPGVQARIDDAVGSASKRRFIGRYVHRVGDDHPWSTAVVAAVISPVLAVLLARMVHPTQKLVRTSVVAVLAYGLAFSLFYSGLGAGAAAMT
jgi:tetrahydromethanopterin S-methyltransferase subunit E